LDFSYLFKKKTKLTHSVKSSRGVTPLSSDGQNAEIVGDVRGARSLPSGVFQHFRGRLPSQAGEPREQRLTGGVGQIPRSC